MKTKYLALILLISMAGAVTAVNSGHFKRNHTRTKNNLTLHRGSGSQLHLKKTVRDKTNLSKRWKKTENTRNINKTFCQFPEKTNLKPRRK